MRAIEVALVLELCEVCAERDCAMGCVSWESDFCWRAEAQPAKNQAQIQCEAYQPLAGLNSYDDGTGRDGMTGCTVADDLATDEDEREDHIENDQCGQLVRAILRDENVISARAMLGVVNVVLRIRSLHLEYALVRCAARSMSARSSVDLRMYVFEPCETAFFLSPVTICCSPACSQFRVPALS